MGIGLNRLQEIIEPAVTALGYELVGCQMVQERNQNLLRVYVDGDKGVNLDACAQISRQIAAVLDVEDPIAGRYLLEVSSPGLNRPLFTMEHYQRFVGERIKLRLRLPSAEGQRNYVGTLTAVEGELVKLQPDDRQEPLLLKLSDIEKANIVAKF